MLLLNLIAHNLFGGCPLMMSKMSMNTDNTCRALKGKRANNKENRRDNKRNQNDQEIVQWAWQEWICRRVEPWPYCRHYARFN